MLCTCAAKLVKSKLPELQFNASRGWCQKFLKRHSLTLRMKTSLAQRLPTDLEEHITAFHRHLYRLRCSEDFDEELIGNMDETPPFFDVVPGCTIDKIGRKSVLIRTTGRDKIHLTVTLTVTASGKMLPSFIIFKGKRPLKLTHPSGVVVCVQEKGWIDETLMICYIREIRATHTHKARSLLVLDSFKAYAVLSCEPCHHRKGWRTDNKKVWKGRSQVLTLFHRPCATYL